MTPRKLYQPTDMAAVVPPMAFQARFVYKAMVKLGKPSSVRDIAVEACRIGMSTNQDPERIVRYYLPLLFQHNLIKGDKA